MMRAIDLFCGAGGLSLGLKQAGWTVTHALEINQDAIATHRRNFPNTIHIDIDIAKYNFHPLKGHIDLVAGGPPCQPFSVSGKQLGNNDIRDMVPEFVRAVDEIRPAAFLMENVSGLVSPKFSAYLDMWVEKLRDLGYGVTLMLLNAADYGVPQKRMRVFVVGIAEGINFAFPGPTHGHDASRPYVSVGEALSGCIEDATNNAKVTFCKNPVMRKSPYAGMLFNGKGRPLDINEPSKTIPATAGGNRTHFLDPLNQIPIYHTYLAKGGKAREGTLEFCPRLTVKQSARLQAFPDDFVFTGRKSSQYCQIGNAVPPTLAAAVAGSLLVQCASMKGRKVA